MSFDAGGFAAAGVFLALPKETYGSVRFLHGCASANTVNSNLYVETWDYLHITGTLGGKGMMSRLSNAGTFVLTVTSGVIAGRIAFSDNATGGVVSIDAPTGGVGQFKGLTQSAVEDKYV